MNRIARSVWFGAGLLMLVVTAEGHVLAGSVTPEIDASTLTTGLGLLAAGVLLFRARRSSR